VGLRSCVCSDTLQTVVVRDLYQCCTESLVMGINNLGGFRCKREALEEKKAQVRRKKENPVTLEMH